MHNFIDFWNTRLYNQNYPTDNQTKVMTPCLKVLGVACISKTELVMYLAYYELNSKNVLKLYLVWADENYFLRWKIKQN